MTETLPLPRLQHLLLDLLSPCRTVPQDQLDQLQSSDWDRLLDLLRQHRLAPLLHWQLRHSHGQLVLPAVVQQQLARSYQQFTLRSLALQRELLLVHRLLKAADIPHIALKGAYLAFHVYPHPALRPLRDLDILVPKDQALQAYQVLLDGGLSRIEQYQGLPEATLDISKHLPPLRSPSGNVNVELHVRLFMPHDSDQAATASEADPVHDLSEDPRFWQRGQTADIAGSRLLFESPTDLLYHLIVHAVYDHEFNNGPLLLSDLAFLLDSQPIDWSLFWELAERRGHARGCWLALKLTERYWGNKPIAWPANLALPAVESDTQLSRAAQLMLRDFETRAEVSLHATMDSKPTLAAKAAHVLNRFFVPKTMLAAQYAVRADDWRIFGYYPVLWWRLLTKRLPEFWRARQTTSLHDEALHIRGLREWLQQERRRDFADATT